MAQQTNRREFLRGGLLATAAVMTGGAAGLVVPHRTDAAAPPDVVVSHGTNPAKITRAAVDALGGMKQFVKQGQKVVIKPNMSFSSKPDRAANTSPEIVREVALMCAEAGASRIAVLDYTLNEPRACLNLSGIQAGCADVPNTSVKTVQTKRLFTSVEVKDGKQLKSLSVVTEVLDSDVLIAIPRGKSHSSAGVSLSMKGMMGLVYERASFHSRHNLHDAIVDMVMVLKPALIVVDGTSIMSTGGPGGPGHVIPLNLVIASTDMVAADAQMVALGTWYGRKFEPGQVRHIRTAAERGLGRLDLSKLNVVNLKS